jgi:hypothetical protein
LAAAVSQIVAHHPVVAPYMMIKLYIYIYLYIYMFTELYDSSKVRTNLKGCEDAG